MGFTDGYKTYDTSNGFGSSREWKKAFNARMTEEEAEAILAEQDLDPWQILGCSRSASQAEIKRAFRALITLWHPDKHPNDVEMATKKSQMIIAAYTKLKTN